MNPEKALVVGATGMVGSRLVSELADAGWRVIGMCRRPPANPSPRCEYLYVDVADAAACCEALAAHTDLTHLFYAGRHAHTTTAPEPIEINIAMLRNVLDAAEASAPGLAHVHAVHGGKVYGSTLGPYRTPAKESDPRVLADTFYYGQEDLLRTRQAGQRWTWSTSRPLTVCDGDAAIARDCSASTRRSRASSASTCTFPARRARGRPSTRSPTLAISPVPSSSWRKRKGAPTRPST